MNIEAPVHTAIVLCAGRGKRLAPYTDTTPKPLLPVNNKPTLDFILASLQHAGIKRVVLVTHYLADQIEAYARRQTYFSSEEITCVSQQTLAGTADATLAALLAQPAWFTTPFLLTASDYLVPLPFYKSLLDTYHQSQKAIAISVKRLADDLSMRSSVRFNSEGDVLEVVEKPPAGTAPSQFSANLVFVLPAEIKDTIQRVEPSPRGEKEIQSAVNSYLLANGPGCSLEQAVPPEWSPDML